jgi:hypothetical protein
MEKLTKIVYLTMVSVLLFTSIASAEVLVENKKIDFDLSPEEIREDTYIPLAELENNNLVALDRVNSDKYFVLTEEGYYLLETNKKLIKSNRQNRTLKYSPIKINGHFLVPVEFLNRFLGFDIKRYGNLISPDDQDNIENNLRLRVYLNDDEFDRYDDLEVSIEIMNTGRDDINLRFNSAHKYNIYIKNRFGRVLYSWASGKIFSQARQNIEIEGRDSLSFEEEIDLRQFREGNYILEVEILANNYNFAEIEKNFEIDD